MFDRGAHFYRRVEFQCCTLPATYLFLTINELLDGGVIPPVGLPLLLHINGIRCGTMAPSLTLVFATGLCLIATPRPFLRHTVGQLRAKSSERRSRIKALRIT